jgi:hypothetical protein
MHSRVTFSVAQGELKEKYSLSNYTQQQLGDVRRQYSWERGQIDYLGVDSFENILSQLNAKLA